MQSRAERRRRLQDLYLDGRVVEMRDGSLLYLRALNPYERAEVSRDAQAARSRFTLAVKEIGTDEHSRARAAFLNSGRDSAIEQIILLKDQEFLIDAANSVRDDPEWAERVEIMDSSDELFARPESDEERQLLVKIQSDFVEEMQLRQEGRRESERAERALKEDEELVNEYSELWADAKAGDIAQAEFQLGELYYGVRLCEGIKSPTGDTWDHRNCEGHKHRLYQDKSEVAADSAVLLEVLNEEMAALNMSMRDAKNSDRQGSSSDSSPLPSEAGESEPSTSTEASSNPPGTSLQPSLTP